MSETPWLDLANAEMGDTEGRDDAKILEFYRDAGHPEIHSSSVAWCAAFAGAMLKRTGLPNSGSLLARSYLDWGMKLNSPVKGCIAVLWRGSPNGTQGHVGFVVDFTPSNITLLGGNQGSIGTVSRETFPRSRVVGFRWPTEAAVKAASAIAPVDGVSDAAPVEDGFTWNNATKAKLAAKWAAAQPLKLDAAKLRMMALMRNRARYEAVQKKTGVPWQLILCLHEREASGDMDAYLGNGQPLDEVTDLVPEDRGPFDTFEEGAIDALVYAGFNKVTDWGIESMLFHAEKFNGPGYHNRGVPSPYVWAGTDQYTSGKYVRDHVFNADTVDKQLGVAIMFKALMSLGSLVLSGGIPLGTSNVVAGAGVTVSNTSTTTNFIGVIIGAALTVLGTQSWGQDTIHTLATFGGPIAIIASILNQLHITGGSNANTIDQMLSLAQKVTELSAERDALLAAAKHAAPVAPVVAPPAPVAPPVAASAVGDLPSMLAEIPSIATGNPMDALTLAAKLIEAIRAA